MVQMKVRQKTRHKTPEKYHDTVALNEVCKIKGGKYYRREREMTSTVDCSAETLLCCEKQRNPRGLYEK